MPRCELTGKGPVVKNLVSHSNIKTKSRAFPNVQQKRVFSRVLNEMVNFKLATSTIRDMEHAGGFDTFVAKVPANFFAFSNEEYSTGFLIAFAITTYSFFLEVTGRMYSVTLG